MESKLNIKDLEVLQTNKTISAIDPEYTYVGGEFTTNPNDYVEVLIYDTNETFLESSVVDDTDYKIDSSGNLSLNTGTILRKMGYDRGRYVVKYNFLRKLAGSPETVLVDETNSIYNNEFTLQDDGTIVGVDGQKLTIKENKYFIQEISPTRSEVRLVPDKIKDATYTNDFYKVGTQNDRVKLGGTLNFIADTNDAKYDSLSLELEDSDIDLNNQLASGVLVIDNAFIESVTLPPPSIFDENIVEEIDSDIVQARFIIGDDAMAKYEEGDRRFKYMFDRFKDMPMNTSNLAKVDYYSTSAGLKGIKNLHDTPWNPPDYEWDDDNPATITLTSISSRPQNIACKYTWVFDGYDKQGSSSWDIIRPWTTSFDGDLSIIQPDTPGTLSVVMNNLGNEDTTGKSVTIRLHSKDTHYGVQLTIEPKDLAPSTIYLPASIETG